MLGEALAQLGELEGLHERLVQAWLDCDLREIQRLGQRDLSRTTRKRHVGRSSL